MLNVNLLFEKNLNKVSKYKCRYKDNFHGYVCDIEDFDLGDDFISNIITLFSTYKYPFKLKINLKRCRFKDKLVFILFESACYYAIKELKIKLDLQYHTKIEIENQGIEYSPLRYISNNSNYLIAYCRTISKDKHYRKIFSYSNKMDDMWLGIECSGIVSFFTQVGVSEIEYTKLADAIIELVENGIKHGESDVLVDIDVSQPTWAKAFDDSNYYGINIVVLGYSKTLLGDLLKEKLSGNNQKNFGERYEQIKQAYKYHSLNFNNVYNNEVFYMVSSMQDKVSGVDGSSGKGLTGLISNVESNVEPYKCYLMSGNKILFLKKELLSQQDGFISFSRNGSFVNSVPDNDSIGATVTVLSGVAYNLSLVIKKEEN